MSNWKRAWLSPAAWYFFTAMVSSCVFGLTIGYVALTQPGSVGRLPAFGVALLAMIGAFISMIKRQDILSELEKTRNGGE